MKTHRALPFFALLIAFTACTPVQATRGNLLEPYQIKEVLAGIDERADVVRKIGSPTTVSPFDENIWYYIGQRTVKKGITDPKVVQEKIVMITFDKDGKVGSVKERRDAKTDVPIVQRKTPVSGNEFTFVQQVLGNLGKFNKENGSAIDTSAGND